MSSLASKKCTVCRVGTPVLKEEIIEQHFSGLVGWVREGAVLKKSFTFRNFKEALAFFNEVAEIAEQEDHHPDMGIYRWKIVQISFTTHIVNGLTGNDFIMAAKVDELIK